MRINRTRLIVYRYVPGERIHEHGDPAEASFPMAPPTLKLPAVPKSIKANKHYIMVEALFRWSCPIGAVNWRAFVEPETGAVLFLRALIDGVTGLVFNPIR